MSTYRYWFNTTKLALRRAWWRTYGLAWEIRWRVQRRMWERKISKRQRRELM